MHHFPEEYVTDRSQRFMASEIVREKLMRFTGEELPYSVTVEIERFDYNPDTDGFHINALILVERIGQKKMVIGKNGEKIKTIGREARLDMEELFGRKVYLETWVKVKSGWADDERACVHSATSTISKHERWQRGCHLFHFYLQLHDRKGKCQTDCNAVLFCTAALTVNRA